MYLKYVIFSIQIVRLSNDVRFGVLVQMMNIHCINIYINIERGGLNKRKHRQKLGERGQEEDEEEYKYLKQKERERNQFVCNRQCTYMSL